MLKITICGMMAAALMTGHAFAETGKITVVGEGEVQVVPDAFEVLAVISEAAATSEEALRIVSERQAAFNEGVVKLKGLQTLGLTTGDVSVKASSECENEYSRKRVETVEACLPKFYFATLNLKLTGTPATEAGNLVSYASEFDTSGAEISKFYVRDADAARTRALSLAVANAKEKAQRLAQGADMSLGRIIEMSDSVQWVDNYREESIKVMFFEAQLPQNFIATAPETKTFSSQVQIVFELLENDHN